MPELASDSSQAILGVQEAIPEPCSCGCGKALSGRQKAFASKTCATRFYDTVRPRILNASVGAPREGSIKAAVLGLLHDGDWHSAHDIAAETRSDKHSVMARLSELRRQGFQIESDLPCGSSRRPHRFRLVTRG